MDILDQIFNSPDITQENVSIIQTPETLYDFCVSCQDYFFMFEIKNCSNIVFKYDEHTIERDRELLRQSVRTTEYFIQAYSNSYDIMTMTESEIPYNLFNDNQSCFPWLVLYNATKPQTQQNKILRNSVYGEFVPTNMFKNYVIGRISRHIRPSRLLKMLCELNDYISYRNYVNGNSIVVINTSAKNKHQEQLLNLNQTYKSIGISQNFNASITKKSYDNYEMYFFDLFDMTDEERNKERKHFLKLCGLSYNQPKPKSGFDIETSLESFDF